VGQQSKSLVGTIVKSLDILECFTDDSDEKGIQEISQIVGLPESTTHRIISTLEYRGILLQNPSNKKYRLGLIFLKASDKTKNMSIWKEKAKSYMLDLNEEFNETVNLAIRTEDKAVYIDTVVSTQVLRPTLAVGVKYPCHCTGIGKSLLMDFSEKELSKIINGPLEKLTPNTITDIKSLADDLRVSKERGFAIDNEEFHKGIVCIAAPIRGFGGRIIASLSISIPTVRVDEERLNKVKERIIEVTNNISKEINF